MEWLKDKKNLPIVVGLAVFVFLIAGGLIAFELGAFNGSSAATATPVSTPTASGYPGGSYPGGGGYPGGSMYPGGSPSGGYPGGGGYPGSGGYPGAGGYPGGARTAAAPAAGPTAKAPALNPMVGADPFALPGTHKIPTTTELIKRIAAFKPPLRQVLPPLNLFALRPPRPSVAVNPDFQPSLANTLANTRVSGIVNADDGIFAIVEVNGNSQTVKPGDSLSDGTKVAAIQPTGITLRTPGGGSVKVPLSNGVPDQPQYGGGGFPGGYPGGGFPGGYPGGGYPGGGFPGGGGYPGGGFPGGGYPGGGFGGGGYPGGDGGFGGYPGS